MLKILLLEDSIADADLVSWQLSNAKLRHELIRVETQEEFLRALKEYDPDVILSDHTMPRYDGMSALQDARAKRPATPFIFVSGTLGEDRAVDSLKKGASDYVIKGDLARLPSAIERALHEKRLRLEREQAEQLLRASEEKFKLLAEQAPIGIMLADIRGRSTYCNSEWAAIAGRSVDEILDMKISSLLHPEDKTRVLDELQQMFQENICYDTTYRMVRPSGEIRWVRSRGVGQYDTDGKLFGFIGLLTDITDQRLAEQKITRLSRIQEVLSGINSTIVRVKDREQLCNDACRIAVDKGRFPLSWIGLVDPKSNSVTTMSVAGVDTGLVELLRANRPSHFDNVSANAKKAVVSRMPMVVNHTSDAPEFSHLLDAIRNSGILSIAYLPLCLADQVFGILVLCSEVLGFFTEEEMQLLNELTEDIAFAVDHLEKTERVNYLAYFDALTELPNRTLFIDHLKQQVFDAQQNGQQMAVMVINLEHFRHINESFGESAGDTLLREVASHLVSKTFNPGHLGRLGGDSFGIMAPNIQSIDSWFHLLEQFVTAWMATPFNIVGQDIVVPIHIGIAIYPNDGQDAETLFQNANAALKQAKSSRERISFYAREINARVAEQLHLENRLRRAIELQQFVLHYQPKVDLESNRVCSIEALIRWNDPEQGLVPPGDFIPILEDSGLINEVGMWALRRARDDHALLKTHYPLAPSIAVNVSALQLRRKNFVDEVLEVIDKSIDGQHGIDIEITESLIMGNIEDNIGKLTALRERNVHVAVDDFGTGYSSLSYIAKLPIDILKIDGSFIARMEGSKDDLAIVSTIIALGHSLALKVVAEGVETAAQASMLRALKCDEAQGYLFCRPIPLDELIGRLALHDGYAVLQARPA